MDNKSTDDESSCPLPPVRRAGRDSAGKRSLCALGRDFCVGGRFRAQKWRFKAKNVENLLKNDEFYEFLSALASGYRNKRSQEPDETFVMACWKWKMVFGRPKDKQKHLVWARPLRGARV